MIKKALILYEASQEAGFDITDAFPGLSGEISVSLYFNDHYFEFTTEMDSITFVHECGDETISYEENFSFDIAVKKIRKLCFIGL